MSNSTNFRRRAILVLAAVAGLAAAALSAASVREARGGQESLEQVIARVKPAVVLIEKKLVLGGRAHGSGVIYDASGLILTNHHVVEGAAELAVALQDGRRLPATVVAFSRFEDESYDIDVAVIKVEASGLPALAVKLDSSLVKFAQGQEIVVLGYPGGVATDEVSVTRGIVSAVRQGWIQTDALMVPGNSGGPVIDRQGRLVGLATFGVGPYERIGGIVSINSLKTLAAQSRIPDYPRLREVRIPGISSLRSNASAEFPRSVKTWRVRFVPDDPAQEGRTFTFEEAQGPAEDFNGAQQYKIEEVQAAALAAGQPISKKYYLDASGLYLLGGEVPFWGPWTPNGYVGHWEQGTGGPLPLVRLPVSAGKYWKLQDTWRWRRGSYAGGDLPPVEAEGIATVEATDEAVTVPAGKYDDCFRVTQEFILSTGRPGVGTIRLKETVWYSLYGPVRIVRRVVGTGTWTAEVERINRE